MLSRAKKHLTAKLIDYENKTAYNGSLEKK